MLQSTEEMASLASDDDLPIAVSHEIAAVYQAETLAVKSWLDSMLLGKYFLNFTSNDILSMDLVRYVTESDMQLMGIKPIPMRCLLVAIERLNNRHSMEGTPTTEVVACSSPTLNVIIESENLSLAIIFSSSDTVNMLKQKIEDSTGISKHEQILKCTSRILENNYLMSDYNIDADALIFVERTENNEHNDDAGAGGGEAKEQATTTRYFIHYLLPTTGREIMLLDANPTDTIEHLKTLIMSRDCVTINPAELRLFFNVPQYPPNELSDNQRTLASYNIPNEGWLFTKNQPAVSNGGLNIKILNYPPNGVPKMTGVLAGSGTSYLHVLSFFVFTLHYIHIPHLTFFFFSSSFFSFFLFIYPLMFPLYYIQQNDQCLHLKKNFKSKKVFFLLRNNISLWRENLMTAGCGIHFMTRRITAVAWKRLC